MRRALGAFLLLPASLLWGLVTFLFLLFLFLAAVLTLTLVLCARVTSVALARWSE